MGTVIDMSTARPAGSWKIVVQFERRPDGGLRAWCDAIPGFALSHADVDALIADIQPALEVILTHQLGERFVTTPLEDIRAVLEAGGVIDPSTAGQFVDHAEYVAQRAA